ncbi:TorF family putative porin [Chlorobium sp.]|jgi:hypothetical protein|uniref:TorF family putative porin n=1 Tax=Chlorobium sp. TaxID=1095 RepID=UPI003C46F4C5|nr:hypothetical protein [Chlorobiaceae bacterium]
MKKTAKLATLAIALFAGLGSTAQAEGFKIGADVVSSYVWRGTDLGDSPAIQPALSYTFPGIGVVVGAWGSYAIAEDDDYRYKEVDLYVTVPVGPFSLTLTDYYVPVDDNSDSFDFSDDGPNILEASIGYTYKNLGLLAAINIAGADTDNAKYCEANYKFYDKDGFTAKAVVGAGDETYVEGDNDNFSVVNTGISVSKDRYTASYIYNPDSEKSHLVFMASF